MIDINEYILLSKDIRQSHLRLTDKCLIRGGNSENSRGLLAHVLDTSIPKGQKIHLCHACHNAGCSNPDHMYWGTSKENSQDRMSNGGSTVWENTVKKYGIEEAKQIYAKKSIGNKAGTKNAGVPKSVEHKKNISLNRTGGRKNNADMM